jgi:hypothetical protein
LLLWANGDAKLAANDAAQRILYDACLPKLVTSVNRKSLINARGENGQVS